MDLSKYTEVFIEESKEHLQSLNETLLKLEKNPKEISLINEIFRIAHSFKGMAGTMGFTKMTKLTHVMEDTLHLIRTGEMNINGELLDSLFNCLDALEGYTASVLDSGNEGDLDYAALIKKLSALSEEKAESKKSESTVEKMIDKTTSDKNFVTEQESAQERRYPQIAMDLYDLNIIHKAREMGNFVYRVDMTLEKGCLLKGARAFIFFQILERHGEIVKTVPLSKDIEDENFDFDITAILVSKSEKKEIIKEMESMSEVSFYQAEEVHEGVNVSADVYKTSGEIESKSINAGTEATLGAANASKNKHNKTVRVDIERLDVLMNLVSELIIIKTGLDGIRNSEANQKYAESIGYLERVTTSLHDAVMKVRMVPVETVFNRFPRMIRDMAKELNKEIALEMSGEETELDRTLIDEVGDPLIHLLRNSADHGIDAVEDRRNRGKPDLGNIYLRAYPDGNNVVIEVEDDGNGIDVEKVRKKAVERNLISKDIASTLNSEEVINFLFLPGFSTAEKVTDLSGRGVGLDAVKTKIESLGGVVEVNTEMGRGTKFTIRLPLTLAIIQALLVKVGDEEFAMPLSSIKEVIKVQDEEIKFVQHREVILLREAIVPIVWMHKHFQVKIDETRQVKSHTVVVVKKGDKLTGVVVDNLVGQQEIVIKSLGKMFSKLRIFAGATILGDGNVALIVDVNSLG